VAFTVPFFGGLDRVDPVLCGGPGPSQMTRRASTRPFVSLPRMRRNALDLDRNTVGTMWAKVDVNRPLP
jgi:hypothetical protein